MWRKTRSIVLMQAQLVWGCGQINTKAFVEEGVMHQRGQPVGDLPPDLEQRVAEHVRKIEEAGCFVMPD